MKNYYAILGVLPNVTQEDLRAAWLRKSKELHPDICQRPTAAAEMAEVNEAYEALKTAAKRRAYDVMFKLRQFTPVQPSGAVDLLGMLRDLTRGHSSERFFAAVAPVVERKLAEHGIDAHQATAEQILQAAGWLKPVARRKRRA